MNKPTLQQVAMVMRRNGMVVFTKPYDVTLGGVRTRDNRANTFNDWLFAMYHDEAGYLCGVIVEGTTDAGLFYRKQPMTPKGTCVIAHGEQYRGAFTYMEKDGHRGQEAFRQTGPVDYYLDNNKDEYLDFVNMVTGKVYNTNGHNMGSLGLEVNNWSAGCWGAVVKKMRKLYDVARLQVKHGLGRKFSFAMLHEDMF